MQPDAFADAVITLVKNALTPVQERLSAAEARLAVLGDVRDRVVTLEAKATDVRPIELPPPFNASPFLERVAAAEARLNTLGDLRDRVVVIETKSAQPIPPVDLSEIRDRIVTLEAFTTAPTSTASDTKLVEKFDALITEVNALRERVAIAEMRQLIPGPPGRDGKDGKDGGPGRDGVDGLGYDDMAAIQMDERTFVLKGQRGLQVKEFGTVKFPVQIYKGVYVEGKTYDQGDGVTWGGSEWHCNETTTTKPGDGLKAWTLKVKRGRDGRDGKDAAIRPVISAR